MIRRVSGHSMVPVLPPGIMIIGWSWFVRLKPGRVVIFEHNGLEKVKRIHHINKAGVYVIGDHVEASTDSRHFGPIHRATIKAVVIYPNVRLKPEV